MINKTKRLIMENCNQFSLKNVFRIAFVLFITFGSFSQNEDYTINNEIVKLLPDNVEIVALGDPTHQESTITSFRIDLIKKLVKEKGFQAIAIEGNLFEFYQAHQLFLKDGDIAHYENAMYSRLNAFEMESLYEFVESENKNGNPVYLIGFDSRFSGVTFVSQTAKLLKKREILKEDELIDFIKFLNKASVENIRAIFRNDKKVKRKVLYYIEKILNEYSAENIEDSIFFQTLKNLQFRFEENGIAAKDDLEMADNVLFLQRTLSIDKLILFGSSSHFLKNPGSIQTDYFENHSSTTLGNELKKNIGDKYYYIAYSGLSGKSPKVISNMSNELRAPIENSIENQFHCKNEVACYVNEQTLPILENISCRFLGHSFVSLELWNVIDGLVLLHNIEPFKIKK